MEKGADLLERILDQAREGSITLDPIDPRRIVLYGAGNLGREILARLRSSGLEPLAFADDTAAKQGTVIDELPVLSPEDAVARFGREISFAVTILNPALDFVAAQERLRQRTGQDGLSLFALARMFPDSLLPYLQYDRVERILAYTSEIRRAFNVLTDEESRRQFAAHLYFRLTADYASLPAKSGPAYFPPDLIAPFPANVIFVDCGAYDGDTIRGFLAHQGGQFGMIVAFEPDSQNYAALTEYVRSLGAQTSARIHLHRGAIGEHSGSIRFRETGDMSAAIAPDGTERVEIFALDDAVPRANGPTYIKFDIEGFEMAALRGTADLLVSTRPTLAVSVYHRPADLWEIPLYLHDLGLGYRLHLRTEGSDGMDVVCYALPVARALPA